MFTIDGFVSDCTAALREDRPHAAVRELVAAAVSDPTCARTFVPDRAAFEVLHRSDELTVLHLSLPPTLGSMPHDHLMWAVVGVLDGQEDNSFFVRGPAGLEARGGRELTDSEVLVMGADAIHAIRNPRQRYLSALHVYGGDLLSAPRSEWDANGQNETRFAEARIAGVIERMHAEEERVGRGLSADEVTTALAT